MSITPISHPAARSAVGGSRRRVRQQAYEALVLMAFSAVTSVATAGVLVLLLRLGS
ncbi:hypothetical protein [Nocardioides ferulae]|uniref:hypothetical protein n=1 Tax=Nocardioides ferulae TaxID=2340821 RepID=UPI0013DE215C|nr:hypothetical protein [Nocardioides ferulae]